MDAEVLQTLQSIRTLIQVFIVISFLNLCFGGVRLWLSVREHFRTTFDTLFQLRCGEYFEDGKFDDLVKHCKERLVKRPNDAYALLFLGKAYACQNEYSKAKAVLTKLLSLQPKWGQEHGQATLDAIADAEKCENPTSQSLK